ncbi:hypothetical protein HA402_008736 [Bradysia odoriphaga]|nr:hypothetical protein HA402_008736 [Bradysia odoriphaga]
MSKNQEAALFELAKYGPEYANASIRKRRRMRKKYRDAAYEAHRSKHNEMTSAIDSVDPVEYDYASPEIHFDSATTETSGQDCVEMTTASSVDTQDSENPTSPLKPESEHPVHRPYEAIRMQQEREAASKLAK